MSRRRINACINARKRRINKGGGGRAISPLIMSLNININHRSREIGARESALEIIGLYPWRSLSLFIITSISIMNREMLRAPPARGDENYGDADDEMTPGLRVLREN